MLERAAKVRARLCVGRGRCQVRVRLGGSVAQGLRWRGRGIRGGRRGLPTRQPSGLQNSRAWPPGMPAGDARRAPPAHVREQVRRHRGLAISLITKTLPALLPEHLPSTLADPEALAG